MYYLLQNFKIKKYVFGKMSLEVMELFCALIMAVVTQIYMCVKIHRTVHQKKKVNVTV